MSRIPLAMKVMVAMGFTVAVVIFVAWARSVWEQTNYPTPTRQHAEFAQSILDGESGFNPRPVVQGVTFIDRDDTSFKGELDNSGEVAFRGRPLVKGTAITLTSGYKLEVAGRTFMLARDEASLSRLRSRTTR